MPFKKYFITAIMLQIIFSLLIIQTPTIKSINNSPSDPFFYINLLPVGTFGRDFTLEDILIDSLISFSDFEGKAVILDFFTTWCIPCQDSMADFVLLKNLFSNDELVIISISVDDATEITLEDFAVNYDMDWHVVIDSVNLASYYEAFSIPTIYVFDTDLKIHFRQSGNPGVTTLENIIYAILGEDKPTPTTSEPSGNPSDGFWTRNWYWFGILLIFIVIGISVYIQRWRIIEHNKKIHEQKIAEKKRKEK